MRFRTKLVIVNILIAVFILTAIGVSVTQGIYHYTFENEINNLSKTANEVSLTVTRLIKSSKMTEQSGYIYKSLAAYFADEISQAYALKAILFDMTGSVLASTVTDMPDTEYKQYAVEALGGKTQGYVYTTISSANYILFFSPVTVEGELIGICALINPTTQLDRVMNRTIMLFIIAGTVFAVMGAVLYTFSYKKMLRPISEIADYMNSITESDMIKPPEIPYSGNDEIKDLLSGCNVMIERISHNIAQINFEKEKLLKVISSMQDGVVAVNMSDESITTNEKFNEYFPSDTDYFAVVPHIEDIIKRVKETSDSAASEFVYADRHFLMSANPISNPQKQDGALVVIKDITTIRKIEEEQQKFISSVSHELRTPLTTITGYIDLLQRRGTDDKELTQKALNTARKEVQRLLRLVNDLLNINKFNTDGFDFIFTNISPDELISEVVASMNLKAEQNKIVVTYNRISLPEIRGDYDRLKQVLINVIDNAIKYSNPDDAVRIMASYDDEYLEITVRDFGEGIPENKTERVFDTFYRVEEDRSRLRGGVGLGLSIVKNIITKHAGKVSVESISGQGTLVTISLPLLHTSAKINKKDELTDENNQ